MDAKLQRLLDGGREIVSDEWLDEMFQQQPDQAMKIHTAYNKCRLGVRDAYVAWILPESRPVDIEHRNIRGIQFAFASK